MTVGLSFVGLLLAGLPISLTKPLGSGVLNAQTLPLSALMAVPAFVGMRLGFALQDRMDVVQFRRWTLILLVLTGLNLVRRALTMD